eukprot:jgi/Botrbrau1/4976/Bobra.0396s0005.2
MQTRIFQSTASCWAPLRAKRSPRKGATIRCSAAAPEKSRDGPSVPAYTDPALQKAYELGYKAGYGAGVNVNVNVDVDGVIEKDGQVKQDSIQRSVVKAFVWRIFSTSATVTIAYAFFGDTMQVDQALEFGAAEFVIKIVIYLLHERMWQLITFI